MKLLITSNSFGSADPGVFEELEEAGFEIQRNPYGRIMNEDELMELLSDKDAVILGTENLTDRVIDACKKLKVVSRYGVGCDHVDIESLKRHGIALEIASPSPVPWANSLSFWKRPNTRSCNSSGIPTPESST